jgi:hypothetical protein
VSTFALLRRTTEIDGVASVFGRFRAANQSNHQQKWFACTASRNPMIYFVRRFEDTVKNQFHRIGGSQFIIPATVGDRTIQLPCEIRASVDQRHEENWVFGWSPI